MCDEPALSAETTSSREQFAARPHLGPPPTDIGTPPNAVATMATTGGEYEDHVVADSKIANAATYASNDACAFVAEHGRQGPRPAVVDGRKVRVAQPRCRHLHQNLAVPGAIKIDSLNLERPTGRVRAGKALFVENGGCDPHGRAREIDASRWPAVGLCNLRSRAIV